MADAMQEVLLLEESRARAIIQQDWAALEKMTHDDLVYTHSGAYRHDKAGWLGWLRDGGVRYRRIDNSELRAYPHGDTVIVVGKARQEAELQGKPASVDILFSVVWVRKAGAWQFAFWHATQFPKR